MATAARAGELVRRIRSSTTTDGCAWLEDTLGALSSSAGHKGSGTPAAARPPQAGSNPLSSAFAQAARRLGREPLRVAPGEALSGPEEPVPLAGFSTDLAGRIALLLGLADAKPDALEPSVEALYRSGDSREKLAIVRGLSLLPEQARFAWIALDAGRTNDTELFHGVACDNPFAARHYPELEFNKLVMKAAFVRAPLDRIVGLERRANSELARMAMEHVDEQESAGRAFVPEIWLAIAPHAPPGAAARMLGYLSHSVKAQRLGAARGLLLLAQPRTRSFVVERLEVERDEEVRAALLEVVARIDKGTE